MHSAVLQTRETRQGLVSDNGNTIEVTGNAVYVNECDVVLPSFLRFVSFPLAIM